MGAACGHAVLQPLVEGHAAAPRVRVSSSPRRTAAGHGQAPGHRLVARRPPPTPRQLAHAQHLRARELRDRHRRIGLGRLSQHAADLAWIDRLHRDLRQGTKPSFALVANVGATTGGTASRASPSMGRPSAGSAPPARVRPCSSGCRRGRCRRSRRRRNAHSGLPVARNRRAVPSTNRRGCRWRHSPPRRRRQARRPGRCRRAGRRRAPARAATGRAPRARGARAHAPPRHRRFRFHPRSRFSY